MTANERIMQMLSAANVEFPLMPEADARAARCAAFAKHAYEEVTGKKSDGTDVSGGELVSAITQYGVHLVDLIDRLEWALDNALHMNALFNKQFVELENFTIAMDRKTGRTGIRAKIGSRKTGRRKS